MSLIARVTFVALVGATFAAFFVAQRLKSEPPVISVGSILTFFSPNGDAERDVSKISVSIKVADVATIDVVDLDGDRVRRLTEGARMAPYRPLRLQWDGRGDDGAVVADGRYRLRVSLRDEGRSAIVQKTGTTMHVDTKAPRPQVCIGSPCSQKDGWQNIVSQGDRAIDIFTRGRSPRFPTIFRVFRTDLGEPEQVARFSQSGRNRRARWNGLDPAGKPLAPGVYVIQAQVRDTAGNRGLSPATFEPGAISGRPGLTVRGLTAQPPVRPVTAGGRTEFFVDARGAEYRWRVRRVGEGRIVKRGTARDAALVFRAPEGHSGVYLLELRAGRWSTTVPFLVQATERAKVLVVVPTLSWLGADKIDDAPFDGLPNTLTTGDSVRWPRMYASGLPAGFADSIAPLLVFLDRRRIRYDLTSDIDLDLTRNPRATDREGVLLAGSMTWITQSLGRRLRDYVEDGGKLAVFGSDSLRRGVRLRVRTNENSGTLERPTQPAASDPFGTRVARERRVGAGATLSQYEPEDTSFGLMEGALDLPGFTRVQEAVSLGQGKVLAAVGQPLTPEEEAEAARTGKPARELRSALSAVRLGKGTVIRVGLPEWPQRLDEPGVAQVTRNVYDILRGVQPRIRSEG